MRSIKLSILLAILAGSFLPGAAFADKALQNALAKAQFMLRQANAEKVALQKEKNDLQKEFDNYKKDMEQEVKAKERGNKKLNSQIEGVKEKYVELHNQFIELRDRYVASVKEIQVLNNNLQNEKDNFQLCYENNQKLFDVNQEILGKYEHKGFWDVVNQSEPVLGLKQVEIENLVQDYQYKNEDLLVLESQIKKSASEEQVQ